MAFNQNQIGNQGLLHGHPDGAADEDEDNDNDNDNQEEEEENEEGCANIRVRELQEAQ